MLLSTVHVDIVEDKIATGMAMDSIDCRIFDKLLLIVVQKNTV